MITDRDLVLAAAATYGAEPPTFAGLGGTASVFRSIVGDTAIYAIEGTHDNLGWALDAAALPLPSQIIAEPAIHIKLAIAFMSAPDQAHESVEHPDIGFVHGGIFAVLMSVWGQMLDAIHDDIRAGLKVAVTGHSLGAGCAVLATAMLVAAGIPPARAAFFAPPRVGFKKMHELVNRAPTTAYRNGNDPVTDVPFRVLPFWLYMQRPLLRGGKPCLPPWDAHHIDNYIALEASTNREIAAAS